MSSTVQETYIAKAKERSLAIMFILNASQDSYGQLTNNLENRFLLGHDDFPKAMTEAYDMLFNYKTTKNVNNPNQRISNNFQRQCLAFFQHSNDDNNNLVTG